MIFSKKISFTSAILSSALVLSLSGCSEETYQEVPEELWEGIAIAPHVVEGSLHIDTNKVVENKRIYQIEIDVDSSLKGNIPQGTISLDKYTICGYPDCDNDKLFSLNDKKVIAFIYKKEWTSVRLKKTEVDYYLISSKNGIFQYSEEFKKTIKNEIAHQSKISQSNICEQVQQKDKNFSTVKNFIDDMMDKAKTENVYASLEKMGQDAVPSMICLIDDRREPGVKYIQLKNNSPDAWEAYRIYGAETIANALAAILNQITEKYFGLINEIDSEYNRQNAIDGWKTYLWHTYFHTTSGTGTVFRNQGL